MTTKKTKKQANPAAAVDVPSRTASAIAAIGPKSRKAARAARATAAKAIAGAATATVDAAKPPPTALEEAIEVKAIVKRRLDGCDPADMAKYVDAYSRAANVVRQLEKDRKRALASFSDDEVIDYVRALPDRRGEALVVAVQGTSLAGKPLF